jgi:adenylate kinase
VHRADDQPEAIRNRLRVYNDQTAPVLGYYESKGILKNIDAVGGIGEIQGRIADALGC